MSDVNTQEQVQEEAVVESPNQLADAVWNEKVVEEKKEEVVSEKKEEVAATIEEKKEEAKDNIVDANQYLKENLGFDNWELAKKEVEELRKLKGVKPELSFANEDSKKILEALAGGKEDALYDYMVKKRQFAQVEQMSLDKPADAEQVLKLSFQLKYQDLSASEISDLITEKYAKPEKPAQQDDETDQEYTERVAKWNQQCETVDKRMVRDAKIERPELLKLKNELILPEIPKEESKANQPTPEQLAAAKKLSDSFQTYNSAVKELAGFAANVKDKDVDYSVAYTASDADKTQVEASMKAFVESGFDANILFANRWLNQDGTANLKQMTEDLLLLTAKESAFQKIANEAANRRMEEYVKTRKNINLTEVDQTKKFDPTNEKNELDKVRDWAFSV